MGGEPPAICTQCGHPLGPQAEEIAHPKDDDPPENPHFKVQIRDDGEERLQCVESGRLASVATPKDDNIGPDNLSYAELFNEFHGEMPPGMGEASEEVGQGSTQGGGQKRSPGGIYDIDEDVDQMKIIEDVVTNPRYGLNDDHIQEVKDWAMDMDGRLPPATLEDILKNLSGIQKQTAQLIRQRYELKLNKWMRDRSQDDGGPPIGVSMQPMPRQRGSSGSSRRGSPTPQPERKSKNQSQEDEQRGRQDRQDRGRSDPSPDNLREYRRTRRTKRRQDGMDIAVQTVAEEAADEIARELVGQFGGLLDIPRTVLKRKAEKDPDWFLEKAEQLDVDIMEIMEPSEQRKKEMEEERQQSGPEVDNEVDNALEQLTEDETDKTQEQTETPMTTQENSSDAQQMDGNLNMELAEEAETENGTDNNEEERIGEEIFE